MKVLIRLSCISVVLCFYSFAAMSQEDLLGEKLKGFDHYIGKVLKEWNTPGAGVGIVVNDKLVFAKGYGYRDYEKKSPVTPNTLFQIASNTKLFTVIALGKLVDEGKIEWDMPVKNYIPSIQFSNDDLNRAVTIRDMLSHRTGVSRHDLIWYKSDFSRRDLFDRLKYMEPSQPLRQRFLYNNMMYAAAGDIIEQLSGKRWEDYVQQNIFIPLEMKNTMFSIDGMLKRPDYATGYNEKKDTTILFKIPHYSETDGIGPAGSVISSVNDLSHWLIALMNNGQYQGRQALSSSAIKASLEPAIATPNTWWGKEHREFINPAYGMGRWVTSYRGHQLAYHGGSLPGFHSQVSYMPQDSVGVIVFVIGDHSQPLADVISFNIYERMLGLVETNWSGQVLKDVIAFKKASASAAPKISDGKIPGTKPSHSLDDYAGIYENPAYGIVKILKKDSILRFSFHKFEKPLYHYHYDRFDTPFDGDNMSFSPNFRTNLQGEIDQFVMFIDEKDAVFTRIPDPSLSDPAILKNYTGDYEMGGWVVTIELKNGNELHFLSPGDPAMKLIPHKTRTFRVKEFSNWEIEFVGDINKPSKIKLRTASGEYEITRK